MNIHKILRKDVDIIFNPPSRIKHKNFFTLTQLRELVQGAQAQDQHAIDTLCTAFAPLIYKEASKPFIRNTLGEDAVNTAWVIFLDIIHKYQGSKYSQLPGLLQCHLRYELQHAALRHQQTHDYDSLDISNEDDKLLQIADTTNHIDNSTLLLYLRDTLRKLPNTQKMVIEELYLQGKTSRYVCQKHHLSEQTCSTHKKRALKKLRNLLTE